MKNFKFIAFMLFMFLASTKTYSQGNTSIHFGAALPVSDFASGNADNEKAGGAAVGLNLGIQYVYPLSKSGFGLFGGIDINYNGLQQSVKDDLEKSIGLSNANIKYYKYINVPVTAGFNYTFQADKKIGVFANAGLALNFLKITNLEVEVSGQTVKQEMDVANSIGFKIGGGILINKKTSISVNYLGLGEHDVKGKVTAPGYSEDVTGKGKVDLLTLTVGFKL